MLLLHTPYGVSLSLACSELLDRWLFGAFIAWCSGYIRVSQNFQLLVEHPFSRVRTSTRDDHSHMRHMTGNALLSLHASAASAEKSEVL